MNKSIDISPFAGGDRRARGKEKIENILLWLVEFHYSTPSILSKMLHVKVRGQGAFFRRLLNQGLIRQVPIPMLSERLLMLTPFGKERAAMLTEKALDYVTEPSKIALSNVVHTLSVQAAVIHRYEPGVIVISERHLPYDDRSKLPDAVIVSGGIATALEVELTHKKIARIYRGFIDHAKAVKHGSYARVEYIFPSQSLCANYSGKFESESWPIVKYSAAQKLVKTGKVFSPHTDPHFRHSFKFTTEALYKCQML